MDTKMIYWYIIDKTIRETKKDKEMENIFEEIIAGNFPNLKDTEFKTQDTERPQTS